MDTAHSKHDFPFNGFNLILVGMPKRHSASMAINIDMVILEDDRF